MLRPFEREDAERCLAWINDAQNARLLGRCRPVTRLEHEGWYEKNVLDARHAFFAIEERENGAHVGLVWLWNVHPQNRNAELRILIGDHARQGHGIGGEAVSMLLEFAFAHMNLHKVYLYVLEGNRRAVRAFERNGFTVEGTLKNEYFVDGAYVDVLRMAVLRSAWQGSSALRLLDADAAQRGEHGA